MAFPSDGTIARRLDEFLNSRIGRHLRRREQKESFAIYAHGILADGERKSVEPIAARAMGAADDNEGKSVEEADEHAGTLCDRMQARLLKFPAWHHHISVVLSCYAFIVSERVQLFPPRLDGKLELSRSRARPERHFVDSFITIPLAIARAIARWLPRCPHCQHANPGPNPRHGAQGTPILINLPQ
jgi:hypothetical protein